MPFTYTSLAFVWLITLALLGLTASGVVAGSWLLLLVLVALAMPALILRSQHRVSFGKERPFTPVSSHNRALTPLQENR